MVDAVASIASKTASAAPSLGPAADAESLRPQAFTHAGPSDGLANAFQQAVSTLKTQDAALGAKASADPVANAKSAIQAGDGKSLIADTSPKVDTKPAAAANGLGALEQSFDHAVFVSLVSQVVGGVSQAASTLVKQS